MAKAPFRFEPDKGFPHLTNPPIVEAVVHWQARAGLPLESDAVRAALVQKLPEFSTCEPMQRIGMMMKMEGKDAAPVVEHQRGWHGYRLTSDDKLQVVQFTRDGVSFSRLQPYLDWEQLTSSAKVVWQAFLDLAAPVEIQRLGVRFINQLRAATADTLGEFLREPPTCPSNLPLREFVYQSKFAVPDYPYGIGVIKVLQQAEAEHQQNSGLLLDCDVYTTKPMQCDEPAVDAALRDMHWLKNKVFFDLLTDSAVESFT